MSEGDKSISYKFDEAVSAVNDEGEEYTAPGIINSQITEESEQYVSGTTDYIADLTNLTIAESEPNNLNELTNQLLGIRRVYARTSHNSSSNSTWDNTGSVQLYMTV